MIVDIEDDIMDPVMQCTTLPSHSGGSLLQPPITKTKSAQIESRARRDQMKMEILLEPTSNKLLVGDLSYALSWKPYQGDSLNLPDHRAQVDQGSQIKMIQVKEMKQDKRSQELKVKKNKGSRQDHKEDNDKSKQTPTRMSSVIYLRKLSTTLNRLERSITGISQLVSEPVGALRGKLSSISYSSHHGNNTAKFPYLKVGEYDVWAMKMQNYISSTDLQCWNVVMKGNHARPTTTDSNGKIVYRDPVSADEYLVLQRESKARSTLISALPDEHMSDFNHMIDAKDIWDAIKAKFGSNEDLKIKSEQEEVKYVVFLEPCRNHETCFSSLRTRGGLDLLTFEDLTGKLKIPRKCCKRGCKTLSLLFVGSI
ncbi:hypothetical protein Tco_0864800 [Tanacetum coccineum]